MTESDRGELKGAYISLEKHFKTLIDGLKEVLAEKEKRYEDMFQSMRDATLLAKAEIDNRTNLARHELEKELEKLNKLRSDVETDRGELVQNKEYEAKMKDIDLWKGEVNKELTISSTRYSGRVKTASFTAVGALIISLIGLVVMIMRAVIR